MNYVAILAGNRETGGVSPAQAEAARHAVSGEAIHWLAHDVAAEFHIRSTDHALSEALIRASLGDAPIDVAVLPVEHRRKRLLVADMDSTIIGCECIDELADFAGVKAEVADITERAMRGELDFPDALRHRVSLLKGLDLGALQQAYDERVRLNPGARALVRTMNAHGAQTALISGGFTFFTSRVAEIAGFHINRANQLGDDGVRLDGTVAEPILGREAKLAGLVELRDRHGLLPEQTLAVGDGANDLAMIEASGLGVAYRAKPLVAAAARAKLDHADLTALLYFQGYADHEIVAN
jgi:phosphoserine phosphatase